METAGAADAKQESAIFPWLGHCYGWSAQQHLTTTIDLPGLNTSHSLILILTKQTRKKVKRPHNLQTVVHSSLFYIKFPLNQTLMYKLKLSFNMHYRILRWQQWIVKIHRRFKNPTRDAKSFAPRAPRPTLYFPSRPRLKRKFFFVLSFFFPSLLFLTFQ